MAKRPSVEFCLSPAACFTGALMLLILPLKWIFSALIAAFFHELCHYLALRLCRVQIYGFYIGAEGAAIETAPMDRWQECCCALAGPLGSFLLLLLIRWIPTVALCAGIQGLYNLLPIYPFDGGRVLRSVVGKRVSDIIGKGVISILAALGLYGAICMKLGFGAILVTFLLIEKSAFRKIPCKDGRVGVQ